jgi:hypothetical protein
MELDVKKSDIANVLPSNQKTQNSINSRTKNRQICEKSAVNRDAKYAPRFTRSNPGHLERSNYTILCRDKQEENLKLSNISIIRRSMAFIFAAFPTIFTNLSKLPNTGPP